MSVSHDYDWLSSIPPRNRFGTITVTPRGCFEMLTSEPKAVMKREWCPASYASDSPPGILSSLATLLIRPRKLGAPNQNPGKSCARRTTTPETPEKWWHKKVTAQRTFGYDIRFLVFDYRYLAFDEYSMF